jgi:DNA-binding NarL/FixJ family response regulator
MTRVYIADSQPQVRSALRLLLSDLGMQVVGEAADWFTALTEAADTQPDMLVVDWDLIPINSARVDGRIRIEVSDEGQGFNVDAVMTARDSHGLIHIRQRLHLFGGEIAIRSEVGVGTTVTVLAPVMRED